MGNIQMSLLVLDDAEYNYGCVCLIAVFNPWYNTAICYTILFSLVF